MTGNDEGTAGDDLSDEISDGDDSAVSDATDAPDNDLIVVGIGASAGGLAALQEFFDALPGKTGMAFVVVQHLSPNRESGLTEILQRHTAMPVVTVDQERPLKGDHVYVLTASHDLVLHPTYLEPRKSSSPEGARHVIDRFFESLAETFHEQAVAIIISGNQSDGARGITVVKDRGGLTIAQSPEDAEYDSMPRSAIKTDRIDLILNARQMGQRLVAHSQDDGDIKALVDGATDQAGPEDGDAYRRITDQLRRITGHDFSHYKHTTMLRRIDRRRRLHQLDSIEAYSDYLRDDRDEVEALFDDVLITVTSFFRDADAFETLNTTVIPSLFDSKQPKQPLRVWVAGCATGEEAYSIAILLWEEANRRDEYPDFKIFATDLDPRAIARARRGLYSEASCQGLGQARRERFFAAEAGAYRVVRELRDRVLFAVHDVLKDPPFARQDLVSCRNLLIYLDRQAQQQVLHTFHYALRSKGHLFLGSSEFLGDADKKFATLNKRQRIYQRLPGDTTPVRPSTITDHGQPSQSQRPTAPTPLSEDRRLIADRHQRLLLERYAPLSVLVEGDREILHICGNSDNVLRVPAGSPSRDLLKMVLPTLRIPLRSALSEATEHDGPIVTGPITIGDEERPQTLRIRVTPVSDTITDNSELMQVVFEPLQAPAPAADDEDTPDVTLDASLQHVMEQLEVENERLHHQLRETVERYETTTEELKTSNEELLTINEELQSTTEELETSREELQSTNEELITVNEELSNKVNELDKANSDLKNLFGAIAMGLIFLDRKLCIRRFTSPVRNYFNLIDADIGRPLDHMTHHLDYDGLIEDAHQVLDDLQPLEREIRTHEDDWFIVRILPYRTVDDHIDGVVVTFFDITERKEARKRVTESELLFRSVFENASDGLCLFELDEHDQPTTFQEVNASFCSRLGYSESDLSALSIVDVIDPESIDIDAHLHQLQDRGNVVDEVRFVTRSGNTTVDEISSRLIEVDGRPRVLSISRDIAARKAQQVALMLAKEESERLAELRATFMANMSHEIRTPLTSIIGVSQLLQKKDLPQRQDQMVRLIQTSGRRLQQTLDSVLDISRIEAGEMEPRYRCFDLVCQVQEDIDLLQSIADQKEVELQFLCPRNVYQFWTDAGFLNRIVYNLVENAIKFTDEGSVTVSLIPKDDAFVLDVVDTGIGIDEDFLPHLFEKFKQASVGTSRSHDGSGLGMALVRSLVELMEGTISVESKKGVGTTFSITIPEHPQE